MAKVWDEPGGSVEFQKGGDKPTKAGGTWQAPDSFIVTYHRNKQYIPVEMIRFFLMTYEKHEDLRQVVESV